MGNKQLNKKKKSRKRQLIRFQNTMELTKRRKLAILTAEQNTKSSDDIELQMVVESPMLSTADTRSNEKDAWLRAIQRPDLACKVMDALSIHNVCSLHFEPRFFKPGRNMKQLLVGAIPTLNLPEARMIEPMVPTATEEKSPTEEEPEIKFELEDYFSEHEEDLEEALNRKRQHETVPLEYTGKRIKTESEEIIVIQGPQVHLKQQQPSLNYNSEIRKPTVSAVDLQPKSKLTEEIITNVNLNDFPVEFMKSVLSSQNEILTVLKRHVLLQDPDPDLLTFLRLIGAKLSRFSKVKRVEMQNSIIDFMDKRK